MKSESSRSAKQPAAKRKSTSMQSKTDWARLKKSSAPVKATDEHPEVDVRHVVRGIVRRGLQAREYDAFVRRKVEAGRKDMRADRGRSHAEVETEFAARRTALLRKAGEAGA